MIRALKVLVSGGLLLVLLGALDWQSVFEALRGVEYLALAAAFVILTLQFVISAWKWQISLAVHGLAWRIPALIRIGAIGFFFNNFFPTAIGGDIYRTYRTLPGDGQKSRAVSAVLLDRITGLIALLIIATVGAAVLYAREPNPATLLLLGAFAGPPLGVVLLPMLTRIPLVRRLLQALARVPKLDPLVHNARLILNQRGKLMNLLLVSTLFQALAVVAIVFLFASVGVFGVIAESSVVGAASALVSLLPISINGIGVMEGSFALTAQSFDIGFESAMIVSLLLRLSTIVFSLVGALIFLMDKGRAADLAAIEAAKAEPPVNPAT